MRLGGIALASLLLFAPAPAAAQNLRDVPLGARTATMGGAGLATGIDSAMPYLNPAGIAGTPIDTLSVSATAYSFVVASIPRFFRPNGLGSRFGVDRVVEEDSSVSQLAALPTGLAYYAHFGTEESSVVHVLGVSISVPSYEDRSLDATLVAEGTNARVTARQINVDTFRQAFFGPSYAVRIGQDLRIGLSVLGYWADATLDDHLLMSATQPGTGGPSFRNERQQIDATTFGLAAVVGAQARISGNVWGGLAVETRGLPITTGGDLTSTADEAGFDPTRGQIAGRTSSTGSLDLAVSRPFRFSAGVAYEIPSSFTLAADVHVHPPMSDVIRGEGRVSALQVATGAEPVTASGSRTFQLGSRTTVNPSLGVEYQPFTKVAFRAGVFTDFDIIETETEGRRNSRLDWYGASFGVGHKTDPLGATYGVVYRYGRGTLEKDDNLGEDRTQSAAIDYVAHGFMAVLSATLEIGAPVDAIVHRGGRRVGRLR